MTKAQKILAQIVQNNGHTSTQVVMAVLFGLSCIRELRKQQQ
jgi:hypothetical protein